MEQLKDYITGTIIRIVHSDVHGNPRETIVEHSAKNQQIIELLQKQNLEERL